MGVDTGRIGVGMNRLGGAKQSSVLLHTANHSPQAGARDTMSATATKQATVSVYQLNVFLHTAAMVPQAGKTTAEGAPCHERREAAHHDQSAST